MIFTESTIKISNNVSKMDSTIVLYRGDKNVEIRFTILQSPFKYSNTVATNVIESTNASYGQLVIKTPNDKPPIFSEVSATKEGTVLFTITKEMIDEIEELGVYTFQIRLMDENKQSRVTIPPVENGIEIKEPIAIEDDNTTNVVGLAKANYAVATLSDVDTPAFDDNGKYIKTNWNDGDVITNASLNKIEDGIYTTNENVTATKKYVDNGINYNNKQFNNRMVAMNISKNPVSCSTEIYKKPLCDIFPELLNITYNTVFRDSNSFKVNMDNFAKEYPTVKSAYNKLNINLYDENDNSIGNTYGDSINGDGLNVIFINITESLRFYAYFDKALVDGSSTTMETKNGYMTIQLLIPKYNNKQEFIDKIKNLKLTLSVIRTDFLNLNNETIYTPTTDYNPATKKYVDDKVTVKILPVDYNKNCATNVADLEPHSIYMSPNDAKFLYLGYEKLDGSFSGLFLSGNPHGKFIYTGAKDDTKIEVMLEGICHTAYFKTDTVDPHTEKTVFYLTKNNTTEFTPSNDYEPATKKYVDDNILLEQLPILRIDETNKRIYVNCNNMGTYKKYFVPNKYANVYGFSFIYTNEDSSETEIALIGGAMTRDDFILCARNTDTLFILILGGTDKYKYTKSTKTLEKGLYGYLKIGNTQEYAPTENYNPATKKYVDDNMKTAINGVKGDLGTEELTTNAKNLRGAVNELNTQYKDIANKDNIKWGAFDKGYITIVFDDFNDDLADVFTLFKSKNIPLSCAIPAIKIEQGKDTSVLHDVENNGGEILCHGYTSNPITSNSTIDFIKTEFEKSKFLLEKNGLRINGYVRAGGEGSIVFTDILDLFYKNYIYGFSMDEDKLLFSRESLILTIDEFKRKVDNAVKNKQWVKFFAHGFHEVSSELLTQMLDYVNSSAIVPVTYSTMYSKFVIGNLNTERYMTKSDNISAFNYIKEIDDRTFYHEDANLLKNSAWVNFTNDTKWVRDKTNYSKDVYWNVYDRGFYSAVRVNFSDKATVGSVKIYQDTGLSRATKGEILHAGLTVQQQTDDNSITIRIYKQLETETELTLVAEKTYTGKLSDEYISVEWISESSRDVTNYRYEIEVKHPDANSSNLTILYLPRLTFKKIDNRYKNITY